MENSCLLLFLYGGFKFLEIAVCGVQLRNERLDNLRTGNLLKVLSVRIALEIQANFALERLRQGYRLPYSCENKSWLIQNLRDFWTWLFSKHTYFQSMLIRNF